jgi:hypothetical protein
MMFRRPYNIEPARIRHLNHLEGMAGDFLHANLGVHTLQIDGKLKFHQKSLPVTAI